MKVFLPPAIAHEGYDRLLFGKVGLIVAHPCASGKSAIEDQPAAPFWMADGMGDGHWAALRHTEQGKFIDSSRVHDRFEIVHEALNGQFLHIPVRQSGAPLVIA